MNCKKCNATLTENDQFCKNCGAAVNESSAQNNVSGSQPTFTQNEFGGAQQPMNNGMGGQPMNNYQQPANGYMNSYNPQQMYNQPPKSNNTKFILIGIGVAVVVAVVAILIFVLGGNNNNNKLVENPGDTTNPGGTTINNKSTYTVDFKGFTFKIPTDLVYKTQVASILLGDEDETWAAYIEVIEGSYNQLLSNKNQLQGIYQQQGFTSSAAITKTIGGLEFITLELSKGGQNALLGISKANSMNIFGITAYTQSNDFDYELLETVSSILKTAEFNNATNNMSGFEKVDMSGISGLAQ